MKTDLKAFYWVASAYDAPGQSAWHVEVVEQAETLDEVKALGGIAHVERTLSVTQAIEAGFNLTRIADGINAHLMAEIEALQAERQVWRDRHQAVLEQRDQERTRGVYRNAGMERLHRDLGDRHRLLVAALDELGAATGKTPEEIGKIVKERAAGAPARSAP